MKAFAKLGLLLALVVAGRYLRLHNQTTFQSPEKITTGMVLPDSLRFINYTVVQASAVAPTSQQRPSAAAAEDSAPSWY